jgi:hypothetical protein
VNKFALVAFLFCLTSSIVNAQNPSMISTEKTILCAAAKDIFDVLSGKDINEVPVWIGMDDADKKMAYSLFVNSKTKNFTLVQFNQTVACILGTGQNSTNLIGGNQVIEHVVSF